MIILGIDPGTKRVGYGIVKKTGGATKLVDAGLIKVKSGGLAALKEIDSGARKLIKKFKPDKMAIEKLYLVKNQKTGIEVAQARGVVLLAALDNNVPIEEYNPNEIKTGITGYGLADKKAVLKMVRLIIGEPDLIIIDDASDALAIAIISAKHN